MLCKMCVRASELETDTMAVIDFALWNRTPDQIELLLRDTVFQRTLCLGQATHQQIVRVLQKCLQQIHDIAECRKVFFVWNTTSCATAM